MKKIILIIAAVIVLASCSSGWSCKKRYCDIQKKEMYKKNTLATKELIIIANP